MTNDPINGSHDIRIDMKNSWQGESDSFPTTCLRNSHKIPSAKSHRPRLTLNRGWRWETLRPNCRQKIFRETSLLKRGHGSGYITTGHLKYF